MIIFGKKTNSIFLAYVIISGFTFWWDTYKINVMWYDIPYFLRNISDIYILQVLQLKNSQELSE